MIHDISGSSKRAEEVAVEDEGVAAFLVDPDLGLLAGVVDLLPVEKMSSSSSSSNRDLLLGFLAGSAAFLGGSAGVFGENTSSSSSPNNPPDLGLGAAAAGAGVGSSITAGKMGFS